jgi:ATP-dependent exoDNAse (exonuclease V) beta subunit
MSTAALVERTWHSLGGLACTTPQQRVNTETYFQFLREAERENALNDFRILEQRLERLFAQPQIFENGATVVDVMTMHAAKGLEWDVVFIPELHRKGAPDGSRLLNWIDYPALQDGVVLSPLSASAPSENSFYQWFCQLRKQREEAERKRLFYVACTRARNELHLFGALPLTDTGELAPPINESLLYTGWPMLEEHFIKAANDARKAIATPLQNVIPFPAASETVPGLLPALAATAADVVQLNQRRLPSGWRPPVASEPLPWQRTTVSPQIPHSEEAFARAEGSILARTTGDAIHRFLEKIAHDLAAGATISEVQSRITSKSIAAVVRLLGVAPDAQKAVASDVSRAISRTLQDPVAHWLLGRRSHAMTETAISAVAPGVSRNVRIDRAFIAGESPGAAGEDTLWLIDYKTSANGHGDIDKFLAQQQQFYSQQLTTYARLLRPLFPQARNVKLSLYFPSLARLQHWDWTSEDPQS